MFGKKVDFCDYSSRILLACHFFPAVKRSGTQSAKIRCFSRIGGGGDENITGAKPDFRIYFHRKEWEICQNIVQKVDFCKFEPSGPSMCPGGVLWVSKVSRGHLGRVTNRFCADLTTFWWILSEKSGFESTLKTSRFLR